MTKPRTGFLSPDRVARADHRRQLIRRAAAERNISEEELGRRLGYTRARWRAIMTNGRLDGLRADDLAVLGEVLGDAVLEELARARGYRLVRELDRDAAPADVISSLGEHLQHAAKVAKVGAAALEDGYVDDREARVIIAAVAEAARALNELQASVTASVVEPLRRSAR